MAQFYFNSHRPVKNINENAVIDEIITKLIQIIWLKGTNIGNVPKHCGK